MKKLLRTRDEIKRALMTVESLDHKQREALAKIFEVQLDFDGVTVEEYKKILYDLRYNTPGSDLSDTDLKGLEKLLARLENS